MCGYSHRRASWILCALWGLCVLSSGCAKREPAALAQILRISQRNEPATLDPQLATLPDEFFILRALSEGLVTPNPDGGQPLPGVAESWEVSDNGFTWTFHLRANAKWSNGDQVTSQDFLYSIGHAVASTTLSPKASLFYPIKGVRTFVANRDFNYKTVDFGIHTPDDRTLVLVLERPNYELLPLLASGPWLPVHRATVEKFGRDWTRPGNFVGNGPFTLTEWLPNQRIVVQRNPDYWDATAVKLEAIHFIAFDSGDTEERAFRAGQIDVTMAVPFSKLDSYRRDAPALLQSVPLHETRYLSLNLARPPLHDVRVRRALSLALDRRTLIGKVVRGEQKPAFSFLPPGLTTGSPQTQLHEDAAEARRLLADAGFPEGKGFPKLEVTAWGVGNQLLEAIQQRWRAELGIHVAVVQREARTHLASLAVGDYDLAFATTIPDYGSALDFLQHFTTGDAGNYPHWSNLEYDRLVAAREYRAAEQVLLGELPLIPLYFNNKNFLLRPTVRGWREDALWTRYYKHVFLQPE